MNKRNRIIAVFLISILCLNFLIPAIAATDKSGIVLATDKEYEDKIHTYTFYNVNDEKLKSDKLVPGEKLLEIAPPDVDGKYFDGWYFEGENKEIKFPYEAKDTDSKNVKIKPKYEYNRFMVKYMSGPKDDKDLFVIGTESYINCPEKYENFKNDFQFSEAGSDKTAVGWEYKSGDKWIEITENDKIKSDLTLYPIIKDVCWITFDTDGGSLIDPAYYIENSTVSIDKLEKPEKEGYTFDGWYINNKKVTGDIKLKSDITLKAKWTPAETSVEVIIWKENPEDKLSNIPKFDEIETTSDYYYDNEIYKIPDDKKTYLYSNSIHVKKNTGYSLNFGELKENTDIKDALNEKGFYLNSSKTDKENGKIVKGDGSTVYNIYLDRDIITYYLEYYPNDFSYSKENVVGKYYWWAAAREGTYLVYKGLYGSKFKWPEPKSGQEGKFYWQNTKEGSSKGPYLFYRYEYDYTKNPDSKKLDQVWLTRRQVSSMFTGKNYPMLLYNMTQELNNESNYNNLFVSTVMVSWANGNYHLKYNFEDSIPGYSANHYERFYMNNPVEGGSIPEDRLLECTLTSSEFDYQNPGNNRLYVYYNLNSYNVIYTDSVNGSIKEDDIEKQSEKKSYKYTEKIIEGKRPEDSKYGKMYSFAGFYEDPQGIKEYKFGSKMPTHDVLVYRVWKPKTVTVTFDPAGGKIKGGKETTFNLKAGETIPKNKIPELEKREGYRFTRWEKDGDLFNFESPITENTVIKAGWAGEKADNSIEFIDDKQILTDKDGYTSGNQIIVPEPEKIFDETIKDYSKFIGWRYNVDGKIYYPGELLTVQSTNENTILSLDAVWEEEREATVTMVVGDKETRETVKKLNNPDVTLNYLIKSINDPSINDPSVVGWTLEKGTEDYLNNDTKLYINNLDNENNKLYANTQDESSINIRLNIKSEYIPLEKPVKLEIELKDKNNNHLKELLNMK